MAPRRLAILGASGNALDILDIVAALNAAGHAWQVAGLLDDAAGPEFAGTPVLGGLAAASALARPGGVLDGARFLLAIGSDRSHAARESILARCGLDEDAFATLVHPLAGVSAMADIAPGCCIGFGASVAGRVRLGAHAWVGPSAVIGHDSVLEPFAMMAPRATISGSVRIGRGAYVGSGAVVRQGVVVGERALIGLGAVVVKDVPPDAVVVGNPARPLNRAALATLPASG
jgi:sugar O-acyltransferase (sialic acid O-acetyltransferase NeuD family)